MTSQGRGPTRTQLRRVQAMCDQWNRDYSVGELVCVIGQRPRGSVGGSIDLTDMVTAGTARPSQPGDLPGGAVGIAVVALSTSPGDSSFKIEPLSCVRPRRCVRCRRIELQAAIRRTLDSSGVKAAQCGLVVDVTFSIGREGCACARRPAPGAVVDACPGCPRCVPQLGEVYLKMGARADPPRLPETPGASGERSAVGPGTYRASFNPQGAAYIETSGGALGIRPDEYSFVHRVPHLSQWCAPGARRP